MSRTLKNTQHTAPADEHYENVRNDEKQISRDTVMAMGRSLWGSIHSSAALVTVPNPGAQRRRGYPPVKRPWLLMEKNTDVLEATCFFRNTMKHPCLFLELPHSTKRHTSHHNLKGRWIDSRCATPGLWMICVASSALNVDTNVGSSATLWTCWSALPSYEGKGANRWPVHPTKQQTGERSRKYCESRDCRHKRVKVCKEVTKHKCCHP